MSQYTVKGYDIKELQNKIFNIFLEFDRICKKYDLHYTLEGGTLLGAVLHKGFIPWDDDMDIIMLRKDYDRFCEIANSELRDPYVFENIDSRPDYPCFFGKCYDTSTLFVGESTSHLDIQHGVFLDIFVEDNIKPSTKAIHCRYIGALNTVRSIKLKIEKFHLRHVLYAPLFVFSTKKLARMADKSMRKYNDKETPYIYPLCQSISSKPALPRRLLTELIPGTFEGFEVPIPKCHMWYLHKHYETPMELPPEEKRHPTHGIKEIKL